MDEGKMEGTPEAAGVASVGKGPVTNCVRCDKWIAGPGPALCEECRAEGYRLCANCGMRVANDTTPYCDVCAEEIVGTG